MLIVFSLICYTISIYKPIKFIILLINEREHPLSNQLMIMKVYKLFFILFLLPFSFSCTEEDLSPTNPSIILETGTEYTANNAEIPVGGKITIKIIANGDGAAITNLTIKRSTSNGIITEVDHGMYLKNKDLDTVLTFVKSSAEQELWTFSILNDHRDIATTSMLIKLGIGSAYGEIDYFPSVTIGYQENTSLPHYLDLNNGIAYDASNISGNESSINLVSYYYLSSGTSSPTLSCPSYETARSFYPAMSDWSVQNSTLYDYETIMIYSLQQNLILPRMTVCL